jgi:hypothetical protein
MERASKDGAAGANTDSLTRVGGLGVKLKNTDGSITKVNFGASIIAAQVNVNLNFNRENT